MEDVSLYLSGLPTHLQLLIIEKMKYEDYCTLMRTSKKMLDLCERNGIRCRLQLDQIRTDGVTHFARKDGQKVSLSDLLEKPCYITATQLRIDNGDSFNDELCEGLVTFFGEHNIHAQELRFAGDELHCSTENVAALIETLKVRSLRCKDCEQSGLLRNPTIRNLDKLCFFSPIPCSEDLLQLKVPSIQLSPFRNSVKTIKEFLKQWLSGEREIQLFTCLNDPGVYFTPSHREELVENLSEMGDYYDSQMFPQLFDHCRSELRGDYLALGYLRRNVDRETLRIVIDRTSIEIKCDNVPNFDVLSK